MGSNLYPNFVIMVRETCITWYVMLFGVGLRRAPVALINAFFSFPVIAVYFSLSLLVSVHVLLL